MKTQQEIDSAAIDAALTQLCEQIVEVHGTDGQLALVGIANGGIRFAERLRERLEQAVGTKPDFGVIDIAFYRDDLGRNPIPKVTEPTELKFDVSGATVILCDDVIFSGRTVRAALNDLFDQGRPRKVELAVLCDRGKRCLPVQPDYCGLKVEAEADEEVAVYLDATDPGEDKIVITAS